MGWRIEEGKRGDERGEAMAMVKRRGGKDFSKNEGVLREGQGQTYSCRVTPASSGILFAASRVLA